MTNQRAPKKKSNLSFEPSFDHLNLWLAGAATPTVSKPCRSSVHPFYRLKVCGPAHPAIRPCSTDNLSEFVVEDDEGDDPHCAGRPLRVRGSQQKHGVELSRGEELVIANEKERERGGSKNERGKEMHSIQTKTGRDT